MQFAFGLLGLGGCAARLRRAHSGTGTGLVTITVPKNRRPEGIS
jgi:hypothetical protein